jgi:DNA-binding MarR family transcriptional regulator
MPSTQKKISNVEATRAWLSVVRAYNLCDAVLTQRLAPLGIRVVEHEVLANLARTPGLTQQQLAERCFAAKSGVSVLITRMEADGWVLREADVSDARAKRLSLTSAGAALARRSMAIQADVVAVMAANMSARELAMTEEVMDRIGGKLDGLLA